MGALGKSLGTLCAAMLLVALCGCAVFVPLREDASSEAPPDDGSVLLRIVACYSALPMAEDLSAAQRDASPTFSVDIVAGDEPSPAELLAGGQADIALVALPADALTPPTLPEAYAAYYPELLAFDALGVMVHQDAALHALTSDELARLFGGYVLDWGQLQAGTGQPELVALPEGTASRTSFQMSLLRGQALCSAALLLPNDRAVVDYLAEHPLAVGFASVASRDPRVHLVAVDGVLPTPKEVSRGSYACTWAIYALVSPQAPAQAEEWLAFARSSAGQDLIAQRYALPQ